MRKEKILLVDDEPDILEFIGYNLTKEGYQLLTAHNGKEAIKIASQEKPDLIILDVMMPEMDGIETCQQIRSIPFLENTLIAFLTARNEDYSQIAGFEAGADDYIPKLTKPRVLMTKIKAILKRKVPVNQFGKKDNKSDSISIDLERYIIKKNGKELILPKKEFELLYLLMEQPGKVYTRDTIMTKVWGEDIIVGERTIDVHIRKLRQKLGDDCIETISGVGYKFKE